MKDNLRIEIPYRLNMATCNELVEVQRSAWGMSDLDCIPPWKFFVGPLIGSHVIVAYDEDRAVAYALLSLAQSASDFSRRYLYLDMLGVSQPYQSRALGFQIMKKAQGLARDRNYAYIAWTYDPLEGANANLYIKKLGAIATKYYENYYGQLTGKQHKRTPTDRFWAVLSPDASPCTVRPQQIITEVEYDSFQGILTKDSSPIGVEIPRDFVNIRDSDPSRAQKIRLATRLIFQTLFAKGYVVNGFYVGDNVNYYVATIR